MHAYFGFRMQKKTEKELENNVTVLIACTNNKVHIAKVYTHSSQKAHQKRSKQLTNGNHSNLLN